ncbi:MAG TPA: response regulator transcription factor [Phycisphaerae bacterium]|nr:response regulator transcription factor [Phycisphaerae bacterium]
MSADIRILLVDDHGVVRESLAERLNRELGFAPVTTAANADEALLRVRESAPDVILMDIDMPGLNCFDAARTITAIRPGAKVIFLSGHVQDNYIEQALEVKARGYLTKGEDAGTVVTAVREVASGGSYFSDAVRARIVIDSNGARLGKRKLRVRVATLTRREKEVLRYVAQGLEKKDIAKFMNLSAKTVDHHITRIMDKLSIHNRVDLARFAFREGFAEA